MSIDISNLTHSEVATLRALLAQHDKSQGSLQKEFDLNNPPRQPYVYMEFPRMVYHHETRQTAVVHDSGQLAHALEAGFDKEPFSSEKPEAPEVPLTAAEKDEIERLDKVARQPKKKAA